MEKGSSSSYLSSADSSLKTIYFEGVSSNAGGGGGSVGPPPLPGPQSPAKKGRSGVVQGRQPPRCQVEGCSVDLSDVKAYYSRHKVCGAHSKSPKVVVSGLEQRFCQQCSRFHQLSEFDQGKRSCRRRLANHNERRRKPQPVSLLSPRYGNHSQPIIDNNCHGKTGSFVMDFTACPNQLPWRSNPVVPGALQGSMRRPSSSSYGGPRASAADDSYQNGSAGSISALSLLSSESWGSRAHHSCSALEVVHGDLVGASSVTVAQPLVQFDCTSWGSKGGQATGSGLQEMNHDLGQYSGDLVLPPQPSDEEFGEFHRSRGYDSSSVPHIHWSL